MGAALAAIVATLAGISSLVDWVADKLGGDPPAPVVNARILDVEPQAPLALGDYLRQTKEPVRDLTAEQLRQVGRVYAVAFQLRGERGSRFSLRWFMTDVDRGTRLRGRSFNQTPAVFEPRSDDQSRTWPVWVPSPLRPGRYQVTFVLENAQREPVDQQLVPPFRVR